MKSVFLYSALGAVAVSLATPALAQNAKAPAPESDPQSGLHDIIVTAQKRTQNVQSTPIAMGVVSGDDIAGKAQNSLDSILRGMTSVEIQDLAQGAQLYIRGVGSSVDPGFADPSI